MSFNPLDPKIIYGTVIFCIVGLLLVLASCAGKTQHGSNSIYIECPDLPENDQNLLYDGETKNQHG